MQLLSWIFFITSSISEIVQHRLFVFLPLGLFPSYFPSITSFMIPSPRKTCPIHFFCCSLMVFTRLLFSSTCCNTSSLLLCCLQLILVISLHIHISKLSNNFFSIALMVYVSDSYGTTLHIKLFMTSQADRKTLSARVIMSFSIVFRSQINPASRSDWLLNPLNLSQFASCKQ